MYRFLALALLIPPTMATGQQTSTPDSLQTEARHVNRSDYWQKSGKTVLGGFKNMYHATVLPARHLPPDSAETRAYPFRMWFFGWADEDCNPGYAGCDAIFHARGKSLDAWEVYCGGGVWDGKREAWAPVLSAQATYFDAWHNGDPSVVWHDGRYYMAYSATGPNKDGALFGQPGDEDGEILCVMGAVSEDGIHWTRSEAPLLIHEPDVGRPGREAAKRPGPHGEFMHGMYHRPSLVYEDGTWRLWFDYWDGTVALGYAEAPERDFLKGGFTVLCAGDRPVLREWPNPAVIKVGKRYYSFADPSGYGQGWPGRQIAEAVSDNGLDWRMLGWIPPDADTPACHVPSPFLHEEDGRTWLVVFYACQIGGEPYDYRYDRIRYMKRDVSRELAAREKRSSLDELTRSALQERDPAAELLRRRLDAVSKTNPIVIDQPNTPAAAPMQVRTDDREFGVSVKVGEEVEMEVTVPSGNKEEQPFIGPIRP